MKKNERNAGRKPLAEDLKQVQVSCRVPPAIAEKLNEQGGLKQFLINHFEDSVMKTILINNKEFDVPESIVSVEVSGAVGIDGGYYQTKFEVKTTSGTDNCQVHVQLCGSEHQSQNGCYLDGEYAVNSEVVGYWDGDEFINPFEYDSSDSEAYTKESEEMDKFVGTLQSIAICLSEKQAEIDIAENLDEESESESGETWGNFRTLESSRHSATSTVEKVVEESSNGRFRIIDDKMSGFVQPNDYTVVPTPTLVAFFENKEELDDYLDNQND